MSGILFREHGARQEHTAPRRRACWLIHFMLGDDPPFYVPGDYAIRINTTLHPVAVPSAQKRCLPLLKERDIISSEMEHPRDVSGVRAYGSKRVIIRKR